MFRWRHPSCRESDKIEPCAVPCKLLGVSGKAARQQVEKGRALVGRRSFYDARGLQRLGFAPVRWSHEALGKHG